MAHLGKPVRSRQSDTTASPVTDFQCCLERKNEMDAGPRTIADLTVDADEMIHAFLQVAQLAGVPLTLAELCQEVLPAPHERPRNLPPGLQAVYVFLLAGRCLKVGKAGPKTKARFTSQHYGMHAPSTLAKSILAHRQHLAKELLPDRKNQVESLDEDTVGAWIQHNTTRLHFFLPIGAGAFTLSLLEAFVQCRLNPVFEGKVV